MLNIPTEGSLFDFLTDYIGNVAGSHLAFSEKTGKQFADLLLEKRQRLHVYNREAHGYWPARRTHQPQRSKPHGVSLGCQTFTRRLSRYEVAMLHRSHVLWLRRAAGYPAQ